MAEEMSTLCWISRILVIIGAINWGLMIWNINLVSYLSMPILINIVYALVGLAGIYELIKLFKK